jgi:beta-glucosidase
MATPGRTFPHGFLWGTATAAYQIEGAVHEDGRGPSIWDTFAHTPGNIADSSNGDVADDHYHRYKEDVRLMKSLGATAYRFSIAWPRVVPGGTGAINEKGLDFYARLVDELLANGIEPFATLYHWDLPQALHDRVGGWENRETALAFAEYAGIVADRLGDRVRNFFTINEFTSFIEYGYGLGRLAPGLRLPRGRLNQVRHHAVLGHGLAVQAIRARGRPGARVGPAEQMFICAPVIETPEHVHAAELATREANAGYMTVMLEGRYTDAFLAMQGADAPRFPQSDLKVISSPVDFVGINVYYAQHYVRALDVAPYFAMVPYQESHPVARFPGSGIGMQISPEAMYWGPRHLARIWNVQNIYVTENGAPFAHKPASDGVDYDTDRIMYLRSYLTQLQRATSEGIPVRGYFHWSLLDNFEWLSGYVPRFGLYYVDYATQKRAPKLSASFYHDVIATNQVM